MSINQVPIPAADSDKWPKPVEPSSTQLKIVLDRKPVLWVGEGLSVAAGYSPTRDLIEAMNAETHHTLDTTKRFSEIADQFVDELSGGALANLWQRFFGASRQPTSTHLAIARLAKAGRLHAIVTTNLDTLIEDALRAAGVHFVLQTLEENAATTGDGELRLLKIQGSLTSWKDTIQLGGSYATFKERYAFLVAQLDVLLQQQSVLFLGCSLQESPILDWLAQLVDGSAQTLEVWRAVITEKAWNEAMSYAWAGGHASGALSKGKVRPMLVASDDDLPRLLGEVAAGIIETSSILEIDISLGETLVASFAGCADWIPKDPHADLDFIGALTELRERDSHAVPIDAKGQILPDVQEEVAALRALATRIGAALTEALLSPEARARVVSIIRATAGLTPPLLLLRARAGIGDQERRRVDRFLALPWELLRLEDEHPVEHGKLDLAREAFVDGVPGLSPPQRELSVVATVAAPTDAVALDYEGECYLLWQAMGEEERRLLITDLGTFDALVTAVKTHRPLVVHFTGHGEPGKLLFETDEALSHPVEVRALVDRLRGYLPRLVFLASCYGASIERTEHARDGHRMVDPAAFADDPTWSSAAELHREGVPQVVAWLGPVGDAQSTRAEAAFYNALVRGRSAREAVREARQRCRDPLLGPDRGTLYPLGWAQLAFYHRGADAPIALPATAAGVDIGRDERKRILTRLDRSRGLVGVERVQFGFVGRRSVRAAAIGRWHRGDRILIIHGPGGFGKTALCAELAPILASKLGKSKPARVLALDGRFAGQREEPIAGLWNQVAAFCDGDEWNTELARLEKDGITGEALAGALVWLVRREGGLLVYLDDAESLQVLLDGYDKSTAGLGAWRDAELQVFWSRICAAVVKEKGFGFLASMRYVPENVLATTCLPLPVMREIDLVRLLRWWPVLGRLRGNDMAWLVGRLQGHPRSVQWLEELAALAVEELIPPGGTFVGDLRSDVLERVLPQMQKKVTVDMLLPRVIEAVGEKAKAHLQRCTVLVAPVPWGAILALEDVEGTGNRLAKAGLLSPFETTGDQFWAPHGMTVQALQVVDFEMAKAAHARVGRWFLRVWNDSLVNASLATYHLCMSGCAEEAWEPAFRVIVSLRGAGRYRDAMGWANRLLTAGLVGGMRGTLLLLRVQLGTVLGTPPDDAEAQLKEAADLLPPDDRAIAVAEEVRLLWHRGRLRDAERRVRDEIAHHVEFNGEKGYIYAHLLLFLGRALVYLGEFDEALDSLQRSLDINLEIHGAENVVEAAVVLQEMGALFLARSDFDRAETVLERARLIYVGVSKTQHHPEIASVLHELGRVRKRRGDFVGAKENFSKALLIYRDFYKTDVHPHIARTEHELAFVLFEQGEFSQARAMFEHVLEMEIFIYKTEEHEEPIKTMHSLALVISKQGDVVGAKDVFVRTVALKKRVLGAEHYSTAITEVQLVGLLLEHWEMTLAEYEHAVQVLVHAYKVLLSRLGPDSGATQQAAAYLANLGISS